MAVAVPILVLVGAGAYRSLAVPLDSGSVWIKPVNSDVSTTDHGEEQYAVPFAAGAEIRWGIEVHNPLIVPVTIDGIRPSVSTLAPLITDERLWLSGTQSPAAGIADLRPFEPVELPPDGRVFLVVTERFVDCAAANESWMPGGSLGRSTLPLDVTVLGLSRTAEVAFPWTILYQAPPGACPPS